MKKFQLSEINIPNLSEYLIMILTVFILLLLGTEVIDFQTISYYNYQINIEIIVSVLTFLTICGLKNINKIKIITVLNRFNINTLIIMISYNISTIGLLLLMILSGSVNEVMGVVMIAAEFIILIVNFYANSNEQVSREVIKMVLTKEFTYMLLMLCLLLHNFPFELANIPMTLILSAAYIVIQCNLIYAYLQKAN